jgi:hypothetical protein
MILMILRYDRGVFFHSVLAWVNDDADEDDDDDDDDDAVLLLWMG